MATLIVYEVECHCGSKATSSTLALDNPHPDGAVHIDIEMAVACTRYVCNDCGCPHYTGDLDVQSGDPADCPGGAVTGVGRAGLKRRADR